MKKYKDLAAEIIKNVGGKDNVKSLRHCNTCPTDTAKKSLEKQIPKTPVDNIEQEWFECPTCRRVVVLYHNGKRHHCRCGQSLKWEDIDD